MFSNLKILLIEDNDDHADLIMYELEEKIKKDNLFRVADGEEAIDYLFQKNKFADMPNYYKPTLILLDLRLPKIDGIEVLRMIKSDEHLRRIPVVMLTSSAAETDIIRAYDNYANSYLVKPVDFSKFSKMLESLTDYWLLWNSRS